MADLTPFDPAKYKWREVVADDQFGRKIHHDYVILGYDLQAKSLDMLVRWYGDGGHCPAHRHSAATTVLVLEGEQHVRDLHPDGTTGEVKIRCAGDYGMTRSDSLPHLECGGPDGGVAFFSTHGEDGPIYEFVDEDMKVLGGATIETLIADWESGAQ